MDPPTAEGGALRSQDLRTSADPTSLDGTVLRVNPDTGAAMPDNPNAASADANLRRIIANGLRNPFRFTMRPGTNDLWLGDVGWNSWEEINRVQSAAAPVENFGWPCYEGNGRMSSYDNLNLNICENLYSAGAAAHNQPVYTYNHGDRVSTETCPTGGSAIAGLAFYNGGTFPSAYNNALFFADNTRDCIWVMFAGSNGLPDPADRQVFINQAANPVDIQVGPGGDIYYADFDGGTIRRVRSLAGNHAPSANAAATPTSGQAPLTVNFDGSGSTDPDNDALSYAWDLDSDGAFDDSTSAQASFTYTQTGSLPGTAAGARPERSRGHRHGHDQRGLAPDADDRDAGRGDDLGGRRRDRLLRLGHARGRRRRCRPAASAGRSSSTTARRSCRTTATSTRSRPSPAPRGRSTRLTTRIRRTCRSS